MNPLPNNRLLKHRSEEVESSEKSVGLSLEGQNVTTVCTLRPFNLQDWRYTSFTLLDFKIWVFEGEGRSFDDKKVEDPLSWSSGLEAAILKLAGSGLSNEKEESWNQRQNGGKEGVW